MSVSRGQKITASDINTYNRDYKTYEKEFTGKALSAQDTSFVLNFVDRASGHYNMEFGFSLSSIYNEKAKVEIKNSSDETIFRWYNSDDSPDLNSEGWQYATNGSGDYEYRIRITDGAYTVRLKTYVYAGLKKHTIYTRYKQGETGLVSGDRIALWKTDFSGLEAEFSNEPKVEYALKARFGKREVT